MTWALKGARTGELLTYGGKVLVHDNPHELRFLFRKAEPVRINVSAEDSISLRAHPEMANIEFPIRKEAFRG